ncbi:MAG: metallophosphoesterase family protein [Pseudomonadota bacterium]
MTRIGVISDTHGVLRPEAVEALEGVDLIVHAGDIGKPEVLEALAAIAPLRAVRGNVDKSPWADAVPSTDAFEVEGVFFYLLHDLAELDLDPAAGGFQVVISGHSHQPREEWRDEVLYLNPGSAGPRRFRLPICLSILELADGDITAHHVDLVS